MIVILSVLYCLLLYCQISVCFIVIRTPSPSIRAITSTARGRENNRLLISCTQLHTMTDSALPNDQDKSNTASNKAGIHYSIGQSAKYVVSAAVSAVLLTSTSPLPVYYTVAAVINSVFGKILKRIIRQPRPLLSPKKGNGMPSSHTSAISFFALALYYKSPSFITDIRIQRLVNFSTFGYALLACSWRVKSHLHSISQILAGACVGSIGATIALRLEPLLVLKYETGLSLVSEYLTSQSIPLTIDQVVIGIKFMLMVAAVPVVLKRETISLLKYISGKGDKPSSKIH